MNVDYSIEPPVVHGRLSLAEIEELVATPLDTKPDKILFKYNEFGKPFIKNNPIYFNLSHSHKMAILALNLKFDLGIDIEWKGRQINYLEIGERFFSKNEFNELKSLPTPLI